MESLAGTVVWITGPPASGKTTVARLLIGALRSRGMACLWLDSDDLRAVLTPEADYTDAGRASFYRALAHIARLGAEGGGTVVISATGSRRAFRDGLRAAVSRFVEVWLRCNEAELRRRDVKGLYRRADAGEIRSLPGAGAAYEPPERAEIVLDADRASPEQLAETILRRLDVPRGP